MRNKGGILAGGMVEGERGEERREEGRWKEGKRFRERKKSRRRKHSSGEQQKERGKKSRRRRGGGRGREAKGGGDCGGELSLSTCPLLGKAVCGPSRKAADDQSEKEPIPETALAGTVLCGWEKTIVLFQPSNYRSC